MTNPGAGADCTALAQAQTTASVQPSRVFVGLKIAPDIAHALAELAKPLEREAARSVASSDIHLTLVPPWNESRRADAVARLSGAVDGFTTFRLAFAHVGYGPTGHHPRLLWVDCAAGDELKNLRAALMTAFGQTDARPFQPHVTLVRIPKHGRAVARRHPIDQALLLSQWVTSVELFQSPPKGQRGYQIVASCPLAPQQDAPL